MDAYYLPTLDPYLTPLAVRRPDGSIDITANNVTIVSRLSPPEAEQFGRWLLAISRRGATARSEP